MKFFSKEKRENEEEEEEEGDVSKQGHNAVITPSLCLSIRIPPLSFFRTLCLHSIIYLASRLARQRANQCFATHFTDSALFRFFVFLFLGDFIVQQ